MCSLWTQSKKATHPFENVSSSPYYNRSIWSFDFHLNDKKKKSKQAFCTHVYYWLLAIKDQVQNHNNKVPYGYWSKEQHSGNIVQKCRKNCSNETQKCNHGPHPASRESISLIKQTHKQTKQIYHFLKNYR